jgi:hypothetical protein
MHMSMNASPAGTRLAKTGRAEHAPATGLSIGEIVGESNGDGANTTNMTDTRTLARLQLRSGQLLSLIHILECFRTQIISNYMFNL